MDIIVLGSLCSDCQNYYIKNIYVLITFSNFQKYIFSFKIKSGKTKSMSIIKSSTTRQARPNAIVLNGHPVEEVNQFTYLGTERIVAGTLMWIAESGRLREPLEYCQLFGETTLKFAYLKAMSYLFCCMVQALGMSPNQLPPNFTSL